MADGPVPMMLDAISEQLHASLSFRQPPGAEPGEEASSLRRAHYTRPRELALPVGQLGKPPGQAWPAPPPPRPPGQLQQAPRPPLAVRPPGSSLPAVLDRGVGQKRAFVRPGGVASAWARCVGGTQRTVSVRKRPAGADEGAAAKPPLLPNHGGDPTALAEMAAFLRQRKRCAGKKTAARAPGRGPPQCRTPLTCRPLPARRRFVSEAAKLLAPQPELDEGEELNLVNLPTDLLVRLLCLLLQL